MIFGCSLWERSDFNNMQIDVCGNYYFLLLIIFSNIPNCQMSRSTIRKDTSYSEFRKKNSLSKTNLHKSMLEMDDSLSFIADDKTQELLSMENQLQSLIRNRSLSAKPTSRTITKESLMLSIPKKSQLEEGVLQMERKKSTNCLNQTENPPKTNRSIHFQSFNQTFQIIEQSEVYNEEDNFFLEDKQKNNKIQPKAPIKNERNPLQKRKDSFQVSNPTKPQAKITIKELDQMQKRLESANKSKKFAGRDPKTRKTEIITKLQPQKTERRLQKTTSQVGFATEHTKLRGLELLKEKQIQSRPIIKKKLSTVDTIKPTHQNDGVLIPTKMVNTQQKQKLLKQFDKIKESIKSTQICADNLGAIRNMLKSIEGLIN